MSKVFIEESTLSSIGNAIREKNGTTELIAPQNMAEAIAAIEAGGGGADIAPLIERTVTNVSDSNVTKVGLYAFTNSSIETVDLPNASQVGNYAFATCGRLKNVNLPKVTSIGDNSFEGSGDSTAHLILPEVETIGRYSFQTTYWKWITLPKVKTLNQYSFANFYGHILDFGPDCDYATTESLYNIPYIKALVLRRTASVVSTYNAFDYSNFMNGKTGYLYVPSALVDAYKADNMWSYCSDRIRALEEYTVDGTTTGELDLTKMGIE